MDKATERNLLDREWTAWKNVCEKLRCCGIELRDQGQLHTALVKWGNELVALKLAQKV